MSTFDILDVQLKTKQALLQNCPAAGSSEGVAYRMSFEQMWTAGTAFPTNFPSGGNPHFTAFVGGVHSAADTFWETGQLASRGIELMAEDGTTGTLRAEVAAVARATAYVGSRTGVTSFRVSEACPLVTFTSMVAPTPDWFVGVSGLDLRDGTGAFRATHTVDLRVYDAGTENGERFSRSNAATNPHVPITRLTTASSDTDFSDGVHRTTGAFVGRMIFTKQ